MTKAQGFLAAVLIAATAPLYAQEPVPETNEAERAATIEQLRAELRELRTRERELQQKLESLDAPTPPRRAERLRPAPAPTPAPPRPAPEAADRFRDLEQTMREMEERMAEFQRQFDRNFDLDDLRVGGVVIGPGGRTTVQRGESMSVVHDENGVKVTITRQEDGKEVTDTFEGANMEEVLRNHPELRERGLLGGRAFTFTSPSFRWSTPHTRIAPVEPTPPMPPLPLEIAPLAPMDANRLGVFVSEDGSDKGLLVNSIEPDSLAERIGLEPGDIVTRINGQEITKSEQVRSALKKVKTGEDVNVEIIRDEAPQTLTGKKLSMKGARLR